MCIGKRVFYKVTAYHRKYMEALNLVFNAYEYDLLPMRQITYQAFTRKLDHALAGSCFIYATG